MDKKNFDPNLDIELPPISDIDLSDDFDQPKPEPIITTKVEDNLPKKIAQVVIYDYCRSFGRYIGRWNFGMAVYDGRNL